MLVFSSHTDLAVLAVGCHRFSSPFDPLQLLSALEEDCLQSWEGTWVLPGPGFMLAPCPALSSQRLSSLFPGNAMLENSGGSDGRERLQPDKSNRTGLAHEPDQPGGWGKEQGGGMQDSLSCCGHGRKEAYGLLSSVMTSLVPFSFVLS